MFNAATPSNEPSNLHAESVPQSPSDATTLGENDGQNNSGDSAIDITTIIQKIHSGAIQTSELPVHWRRQCVGYLTMEGMSADDITQLMKISPRTVRRDRSAIRRDEAIMPDMHLGDELLGEYQRFVHAGIQRLTRRANDQSEPPYVRLWAEEAITRMYQRFLETVRKMNYLRDGESRLRYQITTDPAEQKREVERYEAGLTIAAAKDPIPTMRMQQGVLEMLKKLGLGKQKERESNAKQTSNAKKERQTPSDSMQTNSPT